MGCIPCFEKRVRLYMARGLSREAAEKRATQIMPLIQKAIDTRNKDAAKVIVEGDPDYSLPCVGTGGTAPCTDAGAKCFENIDCSPSAGTCSGGTCGCQTPKPNSHLVANNCTRTPNQSECQYCDPSTYTCKNTCTCSCGGTCDYDCDLGRVWNPVTQQCELPAAARAFFMDGFIFVG